MGKVTWEDVGGNWSPSCSSFVGGYNYYGERLYIGRRVAQDGSSVVGRFIPMAGNKSVTQLRLLEELSSHVFMREMLCHKLQVMNVPPDVELNWFRSDGKNAPINAVHPGVTPDGEKQYITRTLHRANTAELNSLRADRTVSRRMIEHVVRNPITTGIKCVAIKSWKNVRLDILCYVVTASNHDRIEGAIADIDLFTQDHCPERIRYKVPKTECPRRIHARVLVDDLIPVEALLDTGAECMVMGQDLIDEINELRKKNGQKAKFVKSGERIRGIGDQRFDADVTAIKLTWGECTSYERVVILRKGKGLILDMDYLRFAKPVIEWDSRNAYTNLRGIYKSHAFADDPVIDKVDLVGQESD